MSEPEISPPSPPMAVSVDAIKRLVDMVEKNGLSELRYEKGDLRVTLRTSAYRPAASAAVAAAAAVTTSAVPDDASGNAEDEGEAEIEADAVGLVRIDSPLMGVFYRAAKPEDAPLVDIGDRVEVGQAIGLIEAMKVFSEVLSESAGVVQAIPVKNGSLVQLGDALIVLEP